MSKFTAQIIFSFSLNPLEARLGFLHKDYAESMLVKAKDLS